MMCEKCKQDLDLDRFYLRKDRGTPMKVCKECRNIQARKKYPEIARKLSEQRKSSRNSDKEEFNRKARERYWKNRDQLLEKARKRESYGKFSNERAEVYRKNNLHKARARQAVSKAIMKGRLIKPKNCCLCNSETILQAHHSDYQKHLEVVWVCHTCHGKLHRKI
jgi:hypothetical protein